MCHLWPESRRGWPCSLPTCRTLPGEDPSLPCWVWTRAGALCILMCNPREGGLRGEADWKLWGQGYALDKVLQIQRKWDKERQGDGCGHFPTAHARGGCRGSRRTCCPIAACCCHLLWAPMMGTGTDLPCKDTHMHQAHISGSQTSRAEPQLELKHVFTQAGNSEDVFSPPQMLLLIC